MSDTLTVTQLADQVKNVVEGSLLLRGLVVEGEVSNCTRASSGHCYFTLKDAGAQIRCVMWRAVAERQPVQPENGASLVVRGDITFYTVRGELQIQVTGVRPVGIGDLFARFEQLKQKLAAEGLFDDERKVPLPPLPFRIGIVTSPEAAAFQDVQNVLRRRFPLAQVILSPCLVQGVDAPPQIIRAVQLLDRPGEIDVILIVRGGGSIEDLWAFNDEGVARAVSDCLTPIVSGVGHETDFTLVDFVSDYRAPTPSAAAEIVTETAVTLPQAVTQTRLDLDALMLSRLELMRESLRDAGRGLDFASPQRRIDGARQTADVLAERLDARLELRLSVARERTTSLTRALDAANPAGLLARGYAVVRKADGSTVRSAGQVSGGERLSVQVQDGAFDVRVDQGDEHGQYRLTGF